MIMGYKLLNLQQAHSKHRISYNIQTSFVLGILKMAKRVTLPNPKPVNS